MTATGLPPETGTTIAFNPPAFARQLATPFIADIAELTTDKAPLLDELEDPPAQSATLVQELFMNKLDAAKAGAVPKDMSPATIKIDVFFITTLTAIPAAFHIDPTKLVHSEHLASQGKRGKNKEIHCF